MHKLRSPRFFNDIYFKAKQEKILNEFGFPRFFRCFLVFLNNPTPRFKGGDLLNL